MLETYLNFCGLQPFAVADLPERVRYKLRVELPLVDDKGNVIVALENLNDTAVPAKSLQHRRYQRGSGLTSRVRMLPISRS